MIRIRIHLVYIDSDRHIEFITVTAIMSTVIFLISNVCFTNFTTHAHVPLEYNKIAID